MNSFRELIVWQKSMDFVTEVYNVTKDFPKEEQFGLSAQMRRAAVSIPSNISEGYGRKSQGDFGRFLAYSIGSDYELQTQIEVSRNIGFLESEKCSLLIERLEEIARMLKSLKSKIK